jgi:hypothetical protein
MEERSRLNSVVLIGLEVPFWDLVVLLIKVALAAIPATLILAMVLAAITLAFSLK